ncbi:tetratricopeptide repeat protein [Actinoallomurus sp. NBC_01490]|uniref:tetratricopeptide repeat protein n=1 Tax=Actinoallomurus sp. NBC_01490 TaxID=2903557 RepID=UPI002E363A3B|nr:tetratricopeptide repeat protein [Actinoallomurus sp. NBC_01490]
MSPAHRSRAARVVEIWAEAERDNFGSGYAIGDDLVLTAAHVVQSDDGALRNVQVRPLGTPDWLTEGVTVVWCRRDDAVDAALLRVGNAPWRGSPDTGALRWGLPAVDERVPCVAIGFPASQTRPKRVRDTDEAVGHLSPNTRAKAERLVIDLDSPPPSGTRDWSGVCGAALLSSRGRRLLGVVVGDLGGFAHRRLEAVSVAGLLADPEFAALAGHPVPEPVHEDEPWPLDPRVLREPYDELPHRHSEARLLLPRHGVVPFSGRAGELASLRDWCRSAESFSVALVTGEGGAGKSRLAAELCVRMREEDGWDAHVADQDLVDDEAWARMDPVWPLLLVFDYAERMIPALTRLAERLANSRHAGPPVRLLLVARQAGGWWRTIDAETDGLFTEVTDLRLALTPAGFGPAERAEQAAAAVAAFAERLGVAAGPAPDVSSDEYDSPLLVHIAALLSVHGERIDADAPDGLRKRLLDRLLDRERRRWGHAQTGWNGGVRVHLGLGEVPAQQAVALAALTEPDRDEARELLRTVPDLADATSERRGQVADWLVRAFPAEDDREGVPAIASLRPDALTERLLATTPGLADLTARLVDEEARTPAHLAHLARMLHALRLAADRDGSVRQVLGALLASRLRELLTAAATAPWSAFSWLLNDCLAEYGDPDADPARSETARAIAEAAQASLEAVHPNLLLGRLAVTHARLAVRHCRGAVAAPPPGELADALIRLGSACTSLGRHDEAVDALREATGILQSPAGPTPDPATLAHARYSLGVALGNAGRFAEAVEESGAATVLYEELSTAEPERYRPHLANSLRNYANDLTDAGRHQEALAFAGRAVKRFAELARTDHDRYGAEFADALSTLAIAYARDGHPDTALSASLQAVAILDGVSAESERLRPDVLHRCAYALINLSADLADLDRHEEAADATARAAAIRERLAVVDLERYGPEYARALDLLVKRSERIGRHDEAMSAAEQRVRVCSALAATDPLRHGRSLADGLLVLGHRSWQAGDARRALDVTQEAVTAYHDLPEPDRDESRPYLAQALHNLSIQCLMAGDMEGAVAAADEAVEIRRALVTEFSSEPAVADLAASLSQLGQTYAALGPRSKAWAAVEEAVALIRQVAESSPGTYRPRLARTLSNAGRTYALTGRVADALVLFHEVVGIRRDLAAADPGRYEPELADTLHNLGSAFRASDLSAQAVPLFEEAATLYLRQAEAGNRETLPRLRETVGALWHVLIETGRFAEAARLTQKYEEYIQ